MSLDEPTATGARRAEASGIVIRAVRKQFGTVTALDGVSLAVAPGEVVAVLGENGAGKSTMLRILGTTVLADSGEARVAGYDVVANATAARAAMGVVLGDERSWYWRLSGRANLEFFAALYGTSPAAARARATELLALVQLDSAADRRFDAYSAGMRARLSIARALLAAPPVLLLDEPSRTLDPLAAEELRRLVLHLAHAERCAVLWVTHDLHEAAEVADRVVLVAAGRIVAEEHGPVTTTELAELVGLSAAEGAPFAGAAGSGSPFDLDASGDLPNSPGWAHGAAYHASSSTSPLQRVLGVSYVLRAFLRREWIVARSYRLPFALQLVGSLFVLVIIHQVGTLVSPSLAASGSQLGRGYFSFAVVGTLVLQIIHTATESFATSLRQEQTTGTLEALLATPTAPGTVILGSGVYPLLQAFATAVVVAAIAVPFGLRVVLDPAWVVLSLVLLLALVALAAEIGVAVAAFTVVFKRGSTLSGLIGSALALIGGVWYPVSSLPRVVRILAEIVPFTWGLTALRDTLLFGRLDVARFAGVLATAIVALPLALRLFHAAVDRARIRGSLGQY